MILADAAGVFWGIICLLVFGGSLVYVLYQWCWEFDWPAKIRRLRGGGYMQKRSTHPSNSPMPKGEIDVTETLKRLANPDPVEDEARRLKAMTSALCPAPAEGKAP